MYRKFKIGRYSTGSSLEPNLTVIIVCYAPLGMVISGFFPNDAIGGFPYPKGVHCTIKPIVHSPMHKGLLVLYIAGAAVISGEQFFFIGFTVPIGIRVLVYIVG